MNPKKPLNAQGVSFVSNLFGQVHPLCVFSPHFVYTEIVGTHGGAQQGFPRSVASLRGSCLALKGKERGSRTRWALPSWGQVSRAGPVEPRACAGLTELIQSM